MTLPCPSSSVWPSVNIEMGFKPVRTQNVGQGEMASLRDKLSV